MAETDGGERRRLEPVDLHDFEGADVWQEGDERARLRGYFPLSPGTPNASDVSAEDLMVVSFELEPGNYLPTHRDSDEELLVVTAGTVEAAVGIRRIESVRRPLRGSDPSKFRSNAYTRSPSVGRSRRPVPGPSKPAER